VGLACWIGQRQHALVNARVEGAMPDEMKDVPALPQFLLQGLPGLALYPLELDDPLSFKRS
jgi:hypothetical protein